MIRDIMSLYSTWHCIDNSIHNINRYHDIGITIYCSCNAVALPTYMALAYSDAICTDSLSAHDIVVPPRPRAVATTVHVQCHDIVHRQCNALVNVMIMT